MTSVQSYDVGAVWVAKNDLCAHIDEFVDEEQTAFEHLLMYEHGAFSLCRHHEHYADEVGSESTRSPHIAF